MNQFRNLKANEIDVRVASINEKGLTLLLYKDARVDQNVLDETFGIFGWKRSHQLIGDRLYCTVEVKNPDTGEWISKQDVGTESYTEKEKGQASDSFKRACFNLGIGRELYTAPFIWIPAGKYKAAEKNGKPTTYDRFKVSEIAYKDGVITRLIIVNESRKNDIVFSLGDPIKEEVDMSAKISTKQALVLKQMALKHQMPEEQIYGRYKRQSIEDMTISDWVDFSKSGEQMLEKWDKDHEG